MGLFVDLGSLWLVFVFGFGFSYGHVLQKEKEDQNSKELCNKLKQPTSIFL